MTLRFEIAFANRSLVVVMKINGPTSTQQTGAARGAGRVASGSGFSLSVDEAEEVPEVAPVSATATAGTATVHAPMPKATAKAPTRPT